MDSDDSTIMEIRLVVDVSACKRSGMPFETALDYELEVIKKLIMRYYLTDFRNDSESIQL